MNVAVVTLVSISQAPSRKHRPDQHIDKKVGRESICAGYSGAQA